MRTIITNCIVLFLGDNYIVLISIALNKVKLQHLGEIDIIDDLDVLSHTYVTKKFLYLRGESNGFRFFYGYPIELSIC